MKQFFKVVSQEETIYSTDEKTFKSKIVLTEIGGGEQVNTFIATMTGKTAQCRFYKGEPVVAVLNFKVKEIDGQQYQEVILDDIIKLKF